MKCRHIPLVLNPSREGDSDVELGGGDVGHILTASLGRLEQAEAELLQFPNPLVHLVACLRGTLVSTSTPYHL